ncbi:hypothetical protein EVAR_79266_1 [Eumeta japonica]|uniref:Uncharacterized protein n=1 Tax=Eumeta variegata TaxID=151549 RepID=A0A4C1TH79_EUMVA|nr:hypothetical protein EVAR_79266_1 [Eumeta japonica]
MRARCASPAKLNCHIIGGMQALNRGASTRPRAVNNPKRGYRRLMPFTAIKYANMTCCCCVRRDDIDACQPIEATLVMEKFENIQLGHPNDRYARGRCPSDSWLRHRSK